MTAAPSAPCGTSWRCHGYHWRNASIINPASRYEMTRKLRVAAIGAGYFSQFQYEAWHRLETVDLVAICNRSPERARETAARYAIPEIFTDVDQMIGATKPDLIDIITPPETHWSAIKAAARHGVDAICQKPFCSGLAEARRAVDLAAEANVPLIVHENFRFQPWYRCMRAAMVSGRIGAPMQATFRLRPGDGQGPGAYLDRPPQYRARSKPSGSP